ncbi:unnamed protein product, partial [Gulo gulo]
MTTGVASHLPGHCFLYNWQLICVSHQKIYWTIEVAGKEASFTFAGNVERKISRTIWQPSFNHEDRRPSGEV